MHAALWQTCSASPHLSDATPKQGSGLSQKRSTVKLGWDGYKDPAEPCRIRNFNRLILFLGIHSSQLFQAIMARAERYKVRRTAAEIKQGRLKRNRLGKREESLINKAHEFHKKAEAKVLLIVSYGVKFQVYTTCPGNPDWKTPSWLAMVSWLKSFATYVPWLTLTQEKDYPPPDVETPDTWSEFLAEQKRKRAERAAEKAQKETEAPLAEPPVDGTDDGVQASGASAHASGWSNPCQFQSPSHDRGRQTSSTQSGHQSTAAKFIFPQRDLGPQAPPQTPQPTPKHPVTSLHHGRNPQVDRPEPAAPSRSEQPTTPEQQERGPHPPPPSQASRPTCQQANTSQPLTSLSPVDDLLLNANDVLGFKSDADLFGQPSPGSAPLSRPRAMRLHGSPVPRSSGTRPRAAPPSPDMTDPFFSDDAQSQTSSCPDSSGQEDFRPLKDSRANQDSHMLHRRTRASSRLEVVDHGNNRVRGNRVRKTGARARHTCR